MAWTLLDTNDTFGRLIALLSNAKSAVTLISPYFDLGADDRLGREIRHALKRGVRVSVVVRSETKRKPEWVAAMKEHVKAGMSLYQVDWLHAKIYCSETEGIVTSLNLLQSSVTKSLEIGLHTNSPDEMAKLRERVQMDVWRHKTALTLDDGVEAVSREGSTQPYVPTPEAVRAAALLFGDSWDEDDDDEESGHCIRCGESIDFDTDRPYCDKDYRSWARYRNDEYEESYCHSCGEEEVTSKLRPQCRSCYRRNSR